MLPGQLAVVAAAALPKTPTPAQFMKGLQESATRRTAPSTDVALFGDTFAKKTCLKGGQAKNSQGTYAAALDFEKILAIRQVSFTNMDDWLVAFAKWVINVDYLFDDDQTEEREICKKQREASVQAPM